MRAIANSILITTLLILFWNTSNAQNLGILNLDFSSHELSAQDDTFTFKLWLKDSLISDYGRDAYVVDILPEGVYTASVYCNQRPLMSYRDVRVDSGMTSTYAFSSPWVDMEEIDPRQIDTTPVPLRIIARFGAIYGNRGIGSENTPVANSFSLFGEGCGYFYFAKYFGMGWGGGYAYQHGFFKADSTVYPSLDRDKERYAYLSVYPDIFFRFAFYNQKISDAKGLDLDLGVRYHIPLALRHALFSDQVKTATRKIHQWNDMRVYGRLGYHFEGGGVGVTFQYRPFDFVKSPFPEFPRFEVGLVLDIDGE